MSTKSVRLCWKCAHEKDIEFYVTGFVIEDLCEGCQRVTETAVIKLNGGQNGQN
jgi:hypothetical protein